jgi:hypothetical protein
MFWINSMIRNPASEGAPPATPGNTPSAQFVESTPAAQGARETPGWPAPTPQDGSLGRGRPGARPPVQNQNAKAATVAGDPSAIQQFVDGGGTPGQSAPTPELGADTSRGFAEAAASSLTGEMGAKFVGARPATDVAAGTLPGGGVQGGSNTSRGDTGGFPGSGPSRAPVKGSAPGPRNLGRTRTR